MLLPFETLPIDQLRKIHRAALGCETTMRDRKKIGRKLAKIVDGDDKRLAARIATATQTVILLDEHPELRAPIQEFLDARKGSTTAEETPKVENVSTGTTAQRIRSAVAQLEPGEARKLLADVGGSFLEEEQLRGEKKEKRKEFTDEIKDNVVEIVKAASDPTNCPDPVGALAKIDVLHTRNKTLEAERKEVTDSYDDEIGTARDHIRHVLDNLNQEKLPGIE